jgi:hypothetical protein
MQDGARFFQWTFIKLVVVVVGFICYIDLAVAQTDGTFGPLGRLADFVMQAGKSTVLNAPAAEAFGLAKSEIPMRALAFKPPGDDHVHVVLVGGSEGEMNLVITHTTLDQIGPMWLTTPSGILLKTIYEDEKGVSVVKDNRFNSDFEAQKAYLLSKVPGG